jgi:pyridoxine kinase
MVKYMADIIPRVAAIHDLSGFGKCSLTVVIPVLSTMGIEVCPLPTAILSTQSEFDNFYFYDFTNQMNEYFAHWKSMNLMFDCIYTGFIGSEKQIHIISDIIDALKDKKKLLTVIDPVMGDDGNLYKTYSSSMKKSMKRLVEKADLITPNYTEACFLLDKKYIDKPMNIKEMKELLKSLSEMGPETVIVTGVRGETEDCINIAYDRANNEYWKVVSDFVPVKYSGTGDIFTSIVIGSILNGKSLPIAINIASEFISSAIRYTSGYGIDGKEGIIFEKFLDRLSNELKLYTYEAI